MENTDHHSLQEVQHSAGSLSLPVMQLDLITLCNQCSLHSI